MTDIHDRSYDYFLNEAPELLQTVEQGLLNLHEGNRLQNVHELMRATHTLKGAAANVGLDTIKKVAHTLEDAFKALYNEEIDIDPELEDLLWSGYECLRLPLTAEITGTPTNEADVLDRAAAVFVGLQEKLGEDFAQQDYIPSSAELGFDIAQSIFEMGVQQRLEELTQVFRRGDPAEVASQLQSQADVFVGLGESLNLPGWGEIAQTTLRALAAHPDRVLEIAEVALVDWQVGQGRVLEGDRTVGGEPSEALQQLAGLAPNLSKPQSKAHRTTLEEELERFEQFLQGDRYGKQAAKSEVRAFFLKAIPSLAQWFSRQRDIPLEDFCFDVAVPKLELEEIHDRKITQETLDYIKNWVIQFSEFLTEESDSPSLCLYRQWSLFSTALAMAKYHYSQDIEHFQQYQKIPLIETIRQHMKRISATYKKHRPVTAWEKNWLELPHLQKLSLDYPMDEGADRLLEEVWGSSEEEENAEVATILPENVDILDQETDPTFSESIEPELSDSSETESSEETREESQRTATAKSRHFVSVDSAGLERLNHRVGELLIGQNRQALEEKKLKRATLALRTQLQQHQETLNQLLHWSEQVKGAIDRHSMKVDKGPSRLSHAAMVPKDFEFLEIEDYQDLETILQSAVAEANGLETETEAINRLVRKSTQVMETQQRLLSLMQDDLVAVRMLPVGEVLERFPLMVQQLSRVHGKLAQLKLTGSDLFIDRELAKKLYDPLLHLVRNAFDHGIEPPEDRRQQGKSETGTIEIRAYNQGTQTILEVRDDGQGLNIEWIRQKAVEGKFLSQEEADRLQIEDLLEVIFEPGFSTAKSVSEISGRGIGLDVVRSQLQSLNGNITVQSKPQQGTTFAMQIPLTLTIAKLLVVQAGGSIYALLLDAIEKILLPQTEQITLFENQRVLYLEVDDRKSMVPVRQLADLMHYSASIADPVVDPEKGLLSISRDISAPVLLLSGDRQRLGLEVDQILGEQELVIRPLGSAIAPPSYIYGCSILSDGSLTLVIDGVAMMQQCLNVGGVKLSDPPQSDSLSLPDRPHPQTPQLRPQLTVVLIVDDSDNLRYSLSQTLEKSGYQVLEARDGREALHRLGQHPEIEVVLCDVEMPRMNGLQFLKHCRQNTEATPCPIVILTSHTSAKYRQIATELGAAAYLTKPYSESELQSTLRTLLVS